MDNVEVDCDEEAYDQPIRFSGEPPNLEEGSLPFPYFPFGRIAFDLLIPFGLQESLYQSPIVSTFTERFRVEIHYMYHLPVAAFRLIEPTSDPDPSQSVVIIRRLLEREFERRQESLIDFQVIGPSPIHADFYLTGEAEGRQESSWTFKLEIEHIRGYDRYNFSFNQDVFPDKEEALKSLLQNLLQEVDVFYLITQYEREKIFAWESLQETSWSVVDLHRERGVNAYFAKTFRTGRLVNDAFISLSEFEGNAIFKDNIVRDVYRRTYASDSPPFLRELVDRRIEERATYPTEQVARLLQLFETRRLSTTELMVVLGSAISGGALGALITVMLGG